MHWCRRQLEQQHLSWGAMLLVVCAVWGTSLIALAEPRDLSDHETAVEAGKDALSSSPKIPWYDPETDDFRAAKVKPPAPPKPSSNYNYGVYELLLVLGWILLIVALATIVYLLMKKFLDREVQGSVVVERGAVGADVVRVEELPVNLKKSPADFLNEALRLYRNGDFAMAIIYLFSHQLLQLDRRHWLRLVKGKTNRQYLREIRRIGTAESEQLAMMFQETVLLFEEVFFGKRLPSQDKIDTVWRDIDKFESLVLMREQSTT